MSVNSHLYDTSSKLIITDSERSVIDNHINALKNKLVNYFNRDITNEYFAFGSYTRKTLMPRRADDRSDVDFMIVFNNAQYAPGTYLRWLKDFAESKYSQSERYQSHPTIVLELSRIKIELVPALKNYLDNYQIPAPASNYSEWLNTSPNAFNTNLTNKNRVEKNSIRPLIRLMKYWNARNGYVYSTYELEGMIVNHNYFMCQNLWDYFNSFVNGLTTYYYPNSKKEKVNMLKSINNEAKRLESLDFLSTAELEIRKAIPIY